MAYAPKILSGVDVLDQSWGGLYRGGSYLVYGRAASGRSLLTMLYTQTGVMLEERCLFISPDRPKDLMILGASMGFNLRQAYEAGLVKLIRIPPMLNLQEIGDEGVAKALNDLVSIVRQNRPSRLVVNDFMPFVQFRSFERFRAAFVQMLEQIDSLDTTLMLVMAEPANQQSRKVIEFMRNQMTGSVHIELIEEEDANSTKRRLTLIPNIGHIKRRVVEYWDLADVVHDAEEPIAPGVRMLPDPNAPDEEIEAEDTSFMHAAPPAPSGRPARPVPQEWPLRPRREAPPEPTHDAPSPAPSQQRPWQPRPAPSQPPSTSPQQPAPPQQSGPSQQARAPQPVQAIPLGRTSRPSQRPPEPAPYEPPAYEPHPAYRTPVPPSEPWYEPPAPSRPSTAYWPKEAEPAPRETPEPAARFEPTRPEERYAPPAARPPYEQEPPAAHPHRPAPREEQPSRYVPQPSSEPEWPTYRTAPEPEPPYRRPAEPAPRTSPPPSTYRPEPAPPYRPQPEPPAPHTPSEAPPSRHTPAEPAAPETRSYRPAPEPPQRRAPEAPVQREAPEPTYRPQPEPPSRPDYQRYEEPPRPQPAPPAPEKTSHTDRDAFRTRLQQHFLRRDVNETPFLLVAMRMDRSEGRAARPFDFEFILDLVSELLRGQDDMFVDLERERLIVLLADSRPEEAQRFFARLKNRLREEAPQQADHLLHSVSAIVVPDGRPFQNAEEFLTYALDEG